MRERRRVPSARSTFAPERGDARRLDVTVAPLLCADNVAIGASMTFEDVTRYAALQTELEGNRRDLELAYEELQSTNDELETTNEELQSTIEELQTTNEELQSTNEELETMNEELQSTNEELETINDELRERTGELNQVNEFLESILTSLGLGVAVVDRAAARAGLEPPRRGPVGPARRRGGRQELSQPGHRPAVRAARAALRAVLAAPASARGASSRRSTGAGGRSSARRRCSRWSAPRPATASACGARSC